MLKDVDDVAEYLAKEWTIACHNKECGGFIQTRNLSTPIQLIAALNEHEKISADQDRKATALLSILASCLGFKLLLCLLQYFGHKIKMLSQR